MEINTKFNEGDRVFFIWDNKVQYVEIYKITTYTQRGSNTSSIYYTMGPFTNMTVELAEDNVFPTKEALLKSL